MVIRGNRGNIGSGGIRGNRGNRGEGVTISSPSASLVPLHL